MVRETAKSLSKSASHVDTIELKSELLLKNVLARKNMKYIRRDFRHTRTRIL